MDGLTRARALKKQIDDNISVLVAPTKQTWPHPDPKQNIETNTIVSLRQDHNLQWSEITNVLNQKPRDAGEPPNFTESAVYSRFVLHTTCTAQPMGEIGFHAKDYVHLRHPNQCNEGESQGSVGVSRAGRKRIKDYDNARELKANVRQAIGAEARSELQTVHKTEQLVEAVAKVERNFWKLVADEMERVTTTLYEPEELARRYHGI